MRRLSKYNKKIVSIFEGNFNKYNHNLRYYFYCTIIFYSFIMLVVKLNLNTFHENITNIEKILFIIYSNNNSLKLFSTKIFFTKYFNF